MICLGYQHRYADHGEHDAILVDTFLSVQHSKYLVDWLAESGKNLIGVYITHAHGDHFLGLKLLLNRFPQRAAVCHCSHRRQHAGPNQGGFCTVFRVSAFSWSDSVRVCTARSSPRRFALS
ncbi:MAG: MBL fold metallo-hydrolase [Acidobacteriaceae bacterium]|nr:MBL fold metallo-hydrolase [Acidobacteriaceae bacterium]